MFNPWFRKIPRRRKWQRTPVFLPWKIPVRGAWRATLMESKRTGHDRAHTCVCMLLLFSRSVVSDSLRPHGLRHTRLPCPSLSPGVCSNSCLLSQWCHPTTPSSIVPFSSCPQSFPASESFPMSQLFAVRWPKYWSFSFSISPSNEYSRLVFFRTNCWFPHCQGTLKNLLQHHSSKASVFRRSAFFMVQLSHSYITTGKTTGLTIQTFVSKVMSLLFNTLSGFVLAFLPRSKCLLISWL